MSTFAEDAGITLRDKPAPLYRLLVLATLLAHPIRSDTAVAAARELPRTPAKMRASTRWDRVGALDRAHYQRYDESTSTRLAEGAELIHDRWHDDLRRLHEEGGGDQEATARLLEEFPGIGPGAASIFLREVQGVWPDLAPYVDERAAEGARKLGVDLDEASAEELPEVLAECVRATLS